MKRSTKFSVGGSPYPIPFKPMKASSRGERLPSPETPESVLKQKHTVKSIFGQSSPGIGAALKVLSTPKKKVSVAQNSPLGKNLGPF